MKIFIFSSSSSNWWDSLNDVIILANSQEEAIAILDKDTENKFENWQKPLIIKEIPLDKSRVIFENFDLG